MNNTLIPFNFNNQSIRIIQDESGEPWFVLADVCKALELTNPTMVKTRLHKEDVQVIDLQALSQIECNKNKDLVNVVNESGLYDVILDSEKPEARKLRHTVTSDILPSIRKTGSYSSIKKSNNHPQLAKDHRARIQLAKMCGLKGNKAILAANDWTVRDDGINVMQSLGVSSMKDDIQSAEITATEIGEQSNVPGNGQGKAQNVNLALWSLGYLDTGINRKGKLAWKISELGIKSNHLEYDNMEKDNGSRSSMQIIIYRDSLIPIIKEARFIDKDFKELKAKRKETLGNHVK